MSELSQAQKEAFARANTSTVNIWALELRHPIWANPVRGIQSKIDLEFELETNAPINADEIVSFPGLAFQIKEPEISDSPDSVLDASVDGVSGYLQPLIAAANKTSVPISVTAREVAYNVKLNSVTQILQIIHLQLRGTRVTKTTISMKFGYTNTANKSFPSQKYTAESNPGLI